MRVRILGGGPAGLYLGILLRRQDPSIDVHIHERQRPGDTFGWGVVFSDRTLENFAAADPESHRAICDAFVDWQDIDIYYGGTRIRSTGHGFCGFARIKLLQILADRARDLGVQLHFESEISSVAGLDDDLIVAADGVNSKIRAELAPYFQPAVDWRQCRFIWLGAHLKLPAFTFIFRDTPHGLFQVHAYPYDDNFSTFIVECRDQTWKNAGFDQLDEAETLAAVGELFRPELQGAQLVANGNPWRRFPTIKNRHWSHNNVVLLGDAAHTAHFSIGSGTKLAMEDAIALAAAIQNQRQSSIPEVLAAYEAVRRPEVERIQKSAQTSLEWFEDSARYLNFPPVQFAVSLMTRSKRITWDELGLRDPTLQAQARAWFAELHGAPPTTEPLFTPFTVRGVTLANRVVVSPMCQYSAKDGLINDWHMVHLGSRAVGGAGLVFTEGTAVSPEGRITLGCAGIWQPEHVEAWRRVVSFVHEHSTSKMGIQIAHSGRRGSCHLPWVNSGAPLSGPDAWPVLGPSCLPYDPASPVPVPMDDADFDKVEADFVAAAQAATDVGFDVLELHFAHGYLLSTFISALTNRRDDRWGGDLTGRLRFPLRVVRAVRKAWKGPLFARISATEWVPGGLDDAERLGLGRALHEAGVDVIDCSAGGVVPEQRPIYGRMFQVPFSDLIRNEARVPTMAVGNVQDADQANTLVVSGRADLVALARAHLADPYLTLHASETYGAADFAFPKQYLAARRTQKKG